MYKRYCEIRDRKGLKDADVARLSGVTKSTFSDWKTGRYNPKGEKLTKIASALGVSLEYLMSGEEIEWNPSEQDFDYSISITEEEHRLLMEYRNADSYQKEMIQRILSYKNNILKGEK